MFLEYFAGDASTFGPAACKGVIHDALSVGCARYSRFPAQLFFTLRQDSIHNARLVPGIDHVRAWFVDPTTGYGPVLLFQGRVSDPNESGEDVIWTAWDYVADLSLSLAGFRRLYPTKKLGTEIARPEWDGDAGDWLKYGAKVKPSSLLKHIATGTFQDPLEADGVTEITTDARFGVIKQPRLLLFFDLSEIGRANTDNNVTYEISRSTTPTFNFWKNKGSAYTAQRLTFPGNVADFEYVRGIRDVRNKLSTIGTSDTGQATEISDSVTAGDYGSDAFGLREDVFTIRTLAGIKANTEFKAQTKITQRAVLEASQPTRAVRLEVRPRYFLPYDGWEIEDTIPVELHRGATDIDGTYRIIGVRSMMNAQGYSQAIFVQLPVAT